MNSVLEDGTLVSYGTSINHKACKSNAGIVRAVAKVSAMLLKPIPGTDNALSYRIVDFVPGEKNKCYCIRMVQMDPKGMIPGWVVNAGKKKAASTFLEMKRVV